MHRTMECKAVGMRRFISSVLVSADIDLVDWYQSISQWGWDFKCLMNALSYNSWLMGFRACYEYLYSSIYTSTIKEGLSVS